MIACNMINSLITIPIAFSIGFRGNAIYYVKLWEALKIVLKKYDVNFQNLRGISDLGKAELCAFNEMDLMSSFYCWFHTLIKCFIPAIEKNLLEKIKKNKIIQILRFIYCSKTISQRNKMVKEIKEILRYETNLNEYFKEYLEEDILNKWTSQYKISQYSENSSNYIESLFGSLTNKNLAKQTKLLNFVCTINSKIENLLISDKENIKRKMNEANVEFEKGYKIYLHLQCDNLGNNVFKVPATEKGKFHTVDLENWFCTCLQFNHNCYTCKHMFYILIEKSIEQGNNYKKLKNVDVFQFMKDTRKYFVTNENLKKLIDFEPFPVTIGTDSFKLKYENKFKF